MAIASELNVYRDTYKLVLLLTRETKQFVRLYRYTLGEKMINTSLNCLKFIQLINVTRDKEKRAEYFDLWIAEFEELKVLIRLSADPSVRCFSERKYSQLITMLSGIGKQITSWKNSINK